MSAAGLQQHCFHAQEDGLTHPTVQRFAGVGTARNAHNGLMNSLVTCGIPPLITRVDSDQMTHTMSPSTRLRLLRAYLMQFSLSQALISRVRTLSGANSLIGNAPMHGRAGTAFRSTKTVDDLDHVVPLTVFTDRRPFSRQKS